MADQTVVHMGENSPEEVAFKLMKTVFNVEGLVLSASRDHKHPDRKELLDTYVECLRAVKLQRAVSQK